jgi:hypothetical protein
VSFVKRFVLAIGTLVVLASAVVAVAAKDRSPDPADGSAPSSSHSTVAPGPDTELQESIERARQRQALVDGLDERLTPAGQAP